MNRFSATTRSKAVVAVERARIWDVLTDPALLPELNPMIERIEADGDLWRWHLRRIAALGVSISPVCTEHMRFEDKTRIDFEHAPPAGVHERAGARGWYVLGDVDEGTSLEIELTVDVELPLPKAAGRAVRKVMTSTMGRTGDKFSHNLLLHLDK